MGNGGSIALTVLFDHPITVTLTAQMIGLTRDILGPLVSPLVRLYQRYRKYAEVAFFFGGVTYDSLTLTRIDRIFDSLLLLAYILLLGALIVLVGRLQTGRLHHPRLLKYEQLYPLAIQFLLGGLFSAYTVFYFQSVSLTKTAIFFGILVFLLAANELFEERLTNLPLLVTLYFFATFSFFIFFIPVLTGVINRWMFLLGAGLSLIPVAGVLVIIYRKIVPVYRHDLLRSAASVSGLFGLLYFFYAMNWIPPVPLSLKFGGIYHQVRREGSVYYLTFEKPPWYRFWKTSEDTFRLRPGDRVYCFASVFAPTKLKTEIVHEWQRYDERRKQWVMTSRRGYTVTGGRDGGYRGYTYQQVIAPGRWRVNVQTPEGLLLGRIRFQVVEAGEDELEFVTIQR